MQDEPISQADRIAVINLFKEIAAFGRQVRERRTAEAAKVQPVVLCVTPQPILDDVNEPPRSS